MSEQNDPTRRSSRIPEFATKEEEAQFWDTHSFTDYLNELEPVKIRFAKNLSNPLTVRLDPQDRAEVTRRAKTQGIGPSTLIRMWVKERLRREADAEPAHP
jgi:predicted HicB family RNase H-like nuclease